MKGPFKSNYVELKASMLRGGGGETQQFNLMVGGGGQSIAEAEAAPARDFDYFPPSGFHHCDNRLSNDLFAARAMVDGAASGPELLLFVMEESYFLPNFFGFLNY